MERLWRREEGRFRSGDNMGGLSIFSARKYSRLEGFCISPAFLDHSCQPRDCERKAPNGFCCVSGLRERDHMISPYFWLS
jgi:hypothetical protein